MSYLRQLTLRLTVSLLLVLLGALALSSGLALKEFERGLVPEIESKVLVLGRSLGRLLDNALAHDLRLEELIGVDTVFRHALERNPEIGMLAITGPSATVLHQAGTLDTALHEFFLRRFSIQSTPPGLGSAETDPIGQLRLASKYQDHVSGETALRLMQIAHVSGHYVVSLKIEALGKEHGFLHIGAKATFVQRVLQENILDVLVVLVVAFFIALEMIYFFAGRGIAVQLTDLMGATSRAAGGKFDRCLDEKTLERLSALAVAVNTALLRINAAHTNLQQTVATCWRGRHTGGKQALRRGVAGLRDLGQRYRFGSGIKAEQGDLSKLVLLRAPFFLFLFAEDLSRTFIPVYTATLITPLPGLSLQFALALPIMLFMLIVALSQLIVSGWSGRIGRRQALLAGALMGALAHFGSAFAFTFYDFLLWRALAGAAWGILFVASQGYVLDHTDARSRTQGLAFFASVVMTSSVCGPSIGGILAEGIGYRGTLLAASVLAAVAAWLIWARLSPARSAPVVRELRRADFAALFANRKFVVFLLTAVMPAKIILIGYCFYLIPLYMPEIGSNAAMAGRLIMLYAVVMVIGIPLTVRWSYDPARHWYFVAAGLFLSGLAGVMPLLLSGIHAVAAMVILLGVAHSLSVAPQTTMVLRVCAAEVASLGSERILGIYRFIERIGNVLAPLIAAALLQGTSFRMTFAAIGLLMLLSGVVFVAHFRAHGRDILGSDPKAVAL
jgi:predicted MFS family arabinose efflux permease